MKFRVRGWEMGVLTKTFSLIPERLTINVTHVFQPGGCKQHVWTEFASLFFPNFAFQLISENNLPTALISLFAGGEKSVI